MFYERIHTSDRPYSLWLGSMSPFAEHRHADFELAYCYEGEFEVVVDRRMYNVHTGDLLILSPMSSHERPPSEKRARTLTAIFGTSFLKFFYPTISSVVFPEVVYSLDENNPKHKRLIELLNETVDVCEAQGGVSSLHKTGNLYKIIGCLIDLFGREPSVKEKSNKDMNKVQNIEKALDMIYTGYMNDLTVEKMAEITGYSKSNFCKIFKNIVGESFHRVLNRHRVRNSYDLLSATSMQVGAVAQAVGFSEVKTFCRVFREITGMTPGEYRKRIKL